MNDFQEYLNQKGACDEAVSFAESHGFDFNKVWQNCERADWMLWLIGRVDGSLPGWPDRKQIVLLTCRIARDVLHLVPKGEDRPLKAIETAEAWARGEDGVTLEDVRVAAYGAAYAAAAAYAAYAADAAYAAETAADATRAARAAVYAADAYVAADATRAADATYAKHKEYAGWIRREWPLEILEGRLK